MTMRRPSKLVCDLADLAPDAVAIDVLAQLKLASIRHGFELRLLNVSGELLELLAFAGLQEALRVEMPGVEVQRQAEQREQGGGVEEERELGDAAV
jgi:hypothetical protein